MNPVAPTKTKRGRKPTWPRIRTITEKSGRTSYRVDAGQFGGKKRLVRQFPTLAEAEQYAEELRGQRSTQQQADRFERANRAVTLANLTDTQRADVLAAFRALDGTRGTLAGAVDFWKKHAAPANARTVDQVHAELLEAARLANRRPRTLYELENKPAGFVQDNAGTPAARLTTADVEAWLAEKTAGLTARSRGAYRQALHRLFAFAVKRGYREGNPVAAIDKPNAEDTTPEILKPAQVRRLLDTAQEIRPELVPYLVIGFFSGLRSAEIAGLDWSQIDFSKRLIFVNPATAKKRRARYVKLEPNLAAWLTPYRQGGGRIFYSRRAIRAVQEKGGVMIPHNGARHSFGSYHLAAFEDAGRTAAQLGHSGDPSVLFNHYRAPVKPSEARAFWNIRPAKKERGKVVPFPQAAAG